MTIIFPNWFWPCYLPRCPSQHLGTLPPSSSHPSCSYSNVSHHYLLPPNCLLPLILNPSIHSNQCNLSKSQLWLCHLNPCQELPTAQTMESTFCSKGNNVIKMWPLLTSPVPLQASHPPVLLNHCIFLYSSANHSSVNHSLYALCYPT